MKDFINPLNDKIVDRMYIFLKNYIGTETVKYYEYKDFYDAQVATIEEYLFNQGECVGSAAGNTSLHIFIKECGNLMNCIYDSYNKYYTLQQFQKMALQATDRYVRDFLVD